MQPGGVDQFVAARRAAQAAVSGGAAAALPSSTGEADRRQARKDAARVERRIDRLTEREKQLHAQMAADAGDYARLAELQAELTRVSSEREQLEEEWLQAAEIAG
jgi:ATP-binding cassette subfamily F protein uup